MKEMIFNNPEKKALRGLKVFTNYLRETGQLRAPEATITLNVTAWLTKRWKIEHTYNPNPEVQKEILNNPVV